MEYLQSVWISFVLCLISFANSQDLVVPFLAENSEPCGGTNEGKSEGHILSPGYPNTTYGPNLNCTYVITAPEGHVITYKSVRIDIEIPDLDTGLCMYDAMRVLDGDTEVTVICGTEPIYMNSTITNRLQVLFSSDFASEGDGFDIEWKIVNPNDRPVSFDCNFDEAIPLCAGWTRNLGDYSWSFTRGFTPSANTGPVNDHTTASEAGRYAYFESSKIQPGSTAILRSPAIEAEVDDEKRCLSFWYHMFGSGMGALLVKQVGEDEVHDIVDIFEGDMGDVWHHGQYTIVFDTSTTHVEFEATKGANYTSDIALDDISLTDGTCEEDFKISIGAAPACPSNLQPSQCFPDCLIDCNSVTTEECSLTCLGGCACPIEYPILHDGSCVELKKCEVRSFIHDSIAGNLWDAIKSALDYIDQ